MRECIIVPMLRRSTPKKVPQEFPCEPMDCVVRLTACAFIRSTRRPATRKPVVKRALDWGICECVLRLRRFDARLGQNGNARRLRSKHLLAVHLNDASICAHGRLWITGEFMNWPLIVAILLISTLPLYAQGQAPDAAKLKADAQKVVTIISSDTAKFHSYCQIVDLADEIEGAKRLIEFLASAEASEGIRTSGLEPLATSR